MNALFSDLWSLCELLAFVVIGIFLLTVMEFLPCMRSIWKSLRLIWQNRYGRGRR